MKEDLQKRIDEVKEIIGNNFREDFNYLTMRLKLEKLEELLELFKD